MPKRKTQLPKSWAPNAEHRARAIQLKIDIEREALKFRLHAEATGRMMKSWNSAFTMWLIMSEEFSPKTNGKKQTPSWVYDDD